MVFKLYVIFMFINLLPFCLYSQKFNVVDFGADKTGKKDSFEAIQGAIDQVTISGGGTIIFPQGKYMIDNSTLVIWGNNLTLKGEGTVIIEKKGGAGWWGDLIAIAGKIPGYKYCGNFGKGNYQTLYNYTGKRSLSQNITLDNITFQTVSENISDKANNLGIINSKNIKILNCHFLDAPQTNLAIVNDAFLFNNWNILIDNCHFDNAGDHNLRVISYNQGKVLGNKVRIRNAHFSNIKKASKLKEINNLKVHIWYRAGASTNSELEISNTFFDSSGNIICTINAKGLFIKNSIINSTIQYLDGDSAEIQLINNKFKKKNSLLFRTDSSEYKFHSNNTFSK